MAHLAHAHSLYEPAGSASKVGLTQCSPHGATQSTGGSVFSGCLRECMEEMPGYYDCTGGEWQRAFSCASGTNCANALCGSGKSVTGYSNSNSSTAHGKNGGHPATVTAHTCH